MLRDKREIYKVDKLSSDYSLRSRISDRRGMNTEPNPNKTEVTQQPKPDMGATHSSEEKRREQIRHMRNGVNFDSIRTYVDVFIVFSVVASGTVLYSFRDPYHWLPPFLVLSYSVVLLFLTLIKSRQINKNSQMYPNCLGAGWVWLLWIVYGIMFQHVHPLLNEAVGYIQSAVAIGLVLTTYWKTVQNSPAYMHAVTVTVALLLFIPHIDTVSHAMVRPILFSKASLFYFLYVITEITIIMEREQIIFSKDSAKVVYDFGAVYNLEKIIVRSAWVLMVSKFLMIGVVFQIAPIFSFIMSFNKKKTKKRTVEPDPERGTIVKERPEVEIVEPIQKVSTPSRIVKPQPAIEYPEQHPQQPKPLTKAQIDLVMLKTKKVQQPPPVTNTATLISQSPKPVEKLALVTPKLRIFPGPQKRTELPDKRALLNLKSKLNINDVAALDNDAIRSVFDNFKRNGSAPVQTRRDTPTTVPTITPPDHSGRENSG